MSSINNNLVTNSALGPLFAALAERNDESYYVLSYLEPSDLMPLGLVVKSTDSFLALAWEKIEQKLKYPVDHKKSSLKNYNIFVMNLKKRIEKYSTSEIPEDVKKILNLVTPPTVAQTQTLQNYIKARDTFIVWRQIAKDVGKPFSSSSYESSEEMIEKAKQFDGWMEENENTLTQIKRLDLGSNQLSSPPDFSRLTQLTWLYLDNNQLFSLPDLSRLTQLTWLDLDDNQLSSLPDLSGLTLLKYLNLSHNQLSSPPDLSRLTQLTWLGLSHNQFSSPPDLNMFSNYGPIYI